MQDIVLQLLQQPGTANETKGQERGVTVVTDIRVCRSEQRNQDIE
jgi:hypothetical protein